MDLLKFARMTRTHSARRELTMSTSSRRFVAGRRCDQLATSKGFAALIADVPGPGSFKQETSFWDGKRICPGRISSPVHGAGGIDRRLAPCQPVLALRKFGAAPFELCPGLGELVPRHHDLVTVLRQEVPGGHEMPLLCL